MRRRRSCPGSSPGCEGARQRVYRPRPLRAKMRGLRGRLRIVAVVLILIGIGAAVLFPDAARTVATLPLLAFFSVLRMVAAYLLSLLFAISYGHTAATNRRAAMVMLPVMGNLHSIPLLGLIPLDLLLVFYGSRR